MIVWLILITEIASVFFSILYLRPEEIVEVEAARSRVSAEAFALGWRRRGLRVGLWWLLLSCVQCAGHDVCHQVLHVRILHNLSRHVHEGGIAQQLTEIR